jgi:hypothetical protein
MIERWEILMAQSKFTLDKPGKAQQAVADADFAPRPKTEKDRDR